MDMMDHFLIRALPDSLSEVKASVTGVVYTYVLKEVSLSYPHLLQTNTRRLR